MASIKDGRGSARTGTISRDRVIERHKALVRDAVRRAVTDGKIDQIGKDGVDVAIPKRDLSQPNIVQGQGGKRTYVHPGNKEHVTGDQIERPRGGGGKGSGKGDPSDSGEGEDDFTIHLNEEEFWNVIYEDLGLPNMNILSAADTTKTQMKYAGIVSQGTPEKISMVRSKRAQIGRMIATTEPENRKILRLRRDQKDILSGYDPDATPRKGGLSLAFGGDISTEERIRRTEAGITRLGKAFGHLVSDDDAARFQQLEMEIAKLRKKVGHIPVFDDVDMKFRHHAKQPVPCAKAAMFCLMDVSGSMDEERKYKAQLFYVLLYKFLKRNYDKIDIVYVRHTTTAQEVDHDDFFHSRDTGGTIVSSGLQMVTDIQRERYNANEWNIYLAQASDGDNWSNDDPKCDALIRAFLPKAQAVFYTEITEGEPQSLWHAYKNIQKDFPNKFWMANIRERIDVVKVFREFFKKNASAETQSRLASMAAPAP